MSYVEIASPEILRIDDDGTPSFGAQQKWYPLRLQRDGGCAPTACADQLLYLSRTQPGLSALCAHDASTRAEMLPLMEAMWQYIERGLKGVDKIAMLSDGALRYARDRGCTLRHLSLEVPMKKGARPSASSLLAYIQDAVSRNLPIAFLNLSSGRIKGLPNWHWMPLIGVDRERGSATLLDEGASFQIDLPRWLETTMIGGGFVALTP